MVVLAVQYNTTVNKLKICRFPYQRQLFEYFMETLDLIGSDSVVTRCLLVLGQICKGCNYPRVARQVQDSTGTLQYAWSAQPLSLVLQKRDH